MVDVTKVYDLYMEDPEQGRSSYLHDHYRRGLLEIKPPERSQEAAHAAWRAGREAGRDTARKTKGIRDGR